MRKVPDVAIASPRESRGARSSSMMRLMNQMGKTGAAMSMLRTISRSGAVFFPYTYIYC